MFNVDYQSISLLRDGLRLKILDLIVRDKVAEAHERTRSWFAMRDRIAACAEGGKIAMIESGRDCDGVLYGGHVTLIEASTKAVRKHWDTVAEWADGAFSLAVEKPSVARGIRSRSRDLALEAFENGHSHVLLPGELRDDLDDDGDLTRCECITGCEDEFEDIPF